MKTVGDYIRKLQEFPEDWPVQVSTQAGGGIAIEHREIKGEPVVAVTESSGKDARLPPLKAMKRLRQFINA